MPSSAGEIPLRRSNRVKGVVPEFEPFDDPERTPKKTAPLSCSPLRNVSGKKTENLRSPELLINGKTKRKQRRSSCTSSDSDSNDHDHIQKNGDGIVSEEEELQTNENEQCLEGIIYKSQVQKFTLESGRPPETTGSSVVHSQRFIWLFPITIIIVAMIVACLAFLVGNFFTETPCKVHNDRMKSLITLFPEQSSKLWGYVSHGKDSAEPFVLLLVHSDQDEVASCLASHIAKMVIECRTKLSVDPIVLDGHPSMKANTLPTLRSQMENRRAMVLLHLEQVSGDVAAFLHYVLDVHEPWVPGGVYVLTLNIPSIDENAKNAFSAVEAFLKDRWSDFIKEDNFVPLITRISNFEYVVKRDNNPCH